MATSHDPFFSGEAKHCTDDGQEVAVARLVVSRNDEYRTVP